MDYSNLNKKQSGFMGFICAILGIGFLDGVWALANRFPEAKIWIMLAVIVLILVVTVVLLMRIQGRTSKKAGILLGVIAACVSQMLFYQFDQNYFTNETWRILAPVIGVVLLFAGGAVSISSYFSMLDEQHRANEMNEKKEK